MTSPQPLITSCTCGALLVGKAIANLQRAAEALVEGLVVLLASGLLLRDEPLEELADGWDAVHRFGALGRRTAVAVRDIAASARGVPWGKPLGAPDDELAHLLKKLGVVHLLLAHAEDQDAGRVLALRASRDLALHEVEGKPRLRPVQCHLMLLSSDRWGGGSVSAKALALLFPQADRWLTRQLGGVVALGGVGRRRCLRLRAAPVRHKSAPASARACPNATSW